MMRIKHSMLISLGIVLVLMTVGTAAAATTYWVNNSTGPTADFTSIQTAIDYANPTDTILVYPGTYTENVYVYKSVNITSTDGAAVTIVIAAEPDNNVFAVYEADNVIISGFNVSGAFGGAAGIYLNICNNTILSNNIVEGNMIGILLEESCNNTMLLNNMVVENLIDGIVVYLSDNCILTDNTVNDNQQGITLILVNNTILTDNIMEGNSDRGIVLLSSHNNRLIGNTAANSNTGITLDECTGEGSNNNELVDNTVTNNYDGIKLFYSNDNRLTSNMVVDNDYYGILLDGSNNTVTNNNVSDNMYGLKLLDVSYNNLIYNNCFNNSTTNSIEMPPGLSVLNTFNSTEMITYVYEGNTYTNYTGNYYSDYEGTDSNDDGIGDSPYSVLSPFDHYPLMFWPVIPVPPIVYPSDALDGLITGIENNEDFSASTIKTLNAKLDNVISTLDKGDYEKAIDQLEKFIDTVEKLKDQEKIEDGPAEELIKSAEDIIKLIEN